MPIKEFWKTRQRDERGRWLPVQRSRSDWLVVIACWLLSLSVLAYVLIHVVAAFGDRVLLWYLLHFGE